MSISTLKFTDLYYYINTSITTNVNNYNASSVTYSNGSLSAAITKYNLHYLTGVKSDVQNQITSCVQANVSLAYAN